MESGGPLGNTIEVLKKRKKNQEKLGSSLSISLGMVYLDVLVKDIRGSDQGKGGSSTGKNQGQLGSGLGISLGMGYLDDLVKDIRVSNQVQRREATGQGKSGSTDSQAEFIHIRASGQPNTKGL